MHFCIAHVAIGGDDQNVVVRGYHDPISWPEIEVIRFLHGDDAVRNVKPFVRVEQSVADEVLRLSLRYGGVVSDKVFTGRKPKIEMDAEQVELVPDQLWHNPLTGLAEMTVKSRKKSNQRDRDPATGRLMSAAIVEVDEHTLDPVDADAD